jgi:hypothetical protein
MNKMFTKNIVTIFIVIFAIGVATLYYYNLSKNETSTRPPPKAPRRDKIISSYDPYVGQSRPNIKPILKKSSANNSNKNPKKDCKGCKKVKFIDDFEYIKMPSLNRKIEVDLDEEELQGYTEPATYEPTSSKTKVIPSNVDQTDPNDTWDSSFGLPLMSADEKRDYFNRMQQNHKKLEKSLGEFTEYQMDRSTVIKTDTSIDPFKPCHHSPSLQDQTIKDIYDSQVSTYKAKPKKVLKTTKSETVYQHESELNGGKINGTKGLHGFDGIGDTFKAASFGNEF